MAHAHSLCSFVWGCGLNPEPDHIGGYTFQASSPSLLHRSPHSPAHEDGRQEVSRTVIFHCASDRSKFNDVKRTRTKRYLVPSQALLSFDLLQLVDGAVEVEVLMKRMVELQQQEECTQEEMVTRFERERSESIPTSTNMSVHPMHHSRHSLGWHLFNHYFLFVVCLLSGGAESTTWAGVASGGGSRVQIWGLCPQRRAGATHHESPGSLEFKFKLIILWR